MTIKKRALSLHMKMHDKARFLVAIKVAIKLFSKNPSAPLLKRYLNDIRKNV